MMDVNLDCIAAEAAVPFVQLGFELCASDYAARAQHEFLEQRELARLQFDWIAFERTAGVARSSDKLPTTIDQLGMPCARRATARKRAASSAMATGFMT